MNKNAIKKFAIEARKKLISSVTDKAGMLGITADGISAPTTIGNDFEVYQTAAGTEVTLNKKQCEQRRRLVEQIETKGFEEVVEEVAYTWFNRICAIRFMEVNDYLPSRVRALSSEKEGKNEPDLVTQAPDVDLDLTDSEKKFVIESKMSGKLDELFAMLFVKQCNKLHEVLPELFEETSDYTEMLLSISFTNKDDVIRMLIDEVPEEDFNITTTDENGNVPGQVEIVGWLYQYYNTEPKSKVFARPSGRKINKEEVPAATQLFTPDWIVRYMVENTLGRLWLDGHSSDELKNNWKYYIEEATQEPEVLEKIRAIQKESALLKPEDLKCIDPCMGSGHILVYLFDVLMQIYESQGYSQRDATLSILQNNLYGIDIDKRAAQMAYFAVMMKARQYDRRILTRNIEPHIFAIEESNGFNRNQLKYFGATLSEEEKKTAYSQVCNLLDQLHDAKEYGSMLLINNYDWDLLNKFAEFTSVMGQMSFDTVGINENQALLKKLISVGKLLAQKYSIVVTNPPYMNSTNMNTKLSSFIKNNYFDYKSDFFSVFVAKCSMMTSHNGRLGFFTPYVWMFIQSYEKMRDLVCNRKDLETLIQFEYSAFEEATVPVCTFTLGNQHINKKGCFIRLSDFRGGMEVQKAKTLEAIRNHQCGYYYEVDCTDFSKIPGAPIAYWVNKNIINAFENGVALSSVARTRQGLASSDNNRFLRLWWEVSYPKLGFGMKNAEDALTSKCKWFPCNKGGEYRKWYGNNAYVVNWENDGKEMLEYAASLYGSPTRTIKNISYYFQEGMTWGTITSGKISMRHSPVGFIPEHAGGMIPLTQWTNKTRYLLGLINSNTAMEFLAFLSPTLRFTEGPVGLLPVIFTDERLTNEIAKLVEENEAISKRDWDSFETSWDYKLHPFIRYRNDSDYLKDINTREYLLKDSYELWKSKAEEEFNIVRKNEIILNKYFASIYGLDNEIVTDVDETDITIRKADLSRDVRSFISYAVGCMFGRFSLDVEGIVFAGGEWDESKYKSFIPDKDNIIPITDEEYFEDDIVGLFCEWLIEGFGKDTLESNLDYIANALGNKGNTSREIIRNYFLNDFYKDHCNMYSVTGSGKRPIYWLFDSGKENGFKALIYMHRYTTDTVGIVRTDYLHKTQKAIEQAMLRAEYTSENASSTSDKKKAVQQITKYTKQLAQMKSYDEAMAHIANQRIEIDLDDGVKVNYEKFQGVEVAQEGKKALKIDLLAKIK